MRVVVAFLILLIVVAGLYYLAGTDRAVTACSADPPGLPVAAQRAVAWSFTPPGFVCSLADENGEILSRLHLGLWP